MATSKLIYQVLSAYDDAKSEVIKTGEELMEVAIKYGYQTQDKKNFREAKIYLLGVQRGGK